MSKNTKLLLIINTIRKVIDIFLGPFLTAYLFKVAVDNIRIISIYNIYSYIVIAIVALIVGRIIKNKYKMQTFRLGMISKFIQLLIIILLGDNIIKYIWVLAIISGISTETWSFPLNLFSSTLVKTDEKKHYVVYRTILNNISKVLVPFLLGTIISIKSFMVTAVIILVLSLIQIILSIFIKDDTNNSIITKKLRVLDEFKKIKNSKKLKQFYKMKFLKGLAYEGALDTTVTLLIIITFKSDFSLGIVTSITSLLAVLSSYIYKQIKSEQRLKIVLITSSIVLFLSSLLIILLTTKTTIIIYNLIFSFFLQFIMVAEELQTLKFTNSKVITDENRVETYILLEFFLNLGRVIGYSLLLIIGFFFNIYLLELLIVVLVFAIILETINLLKFKKSEC